TDGPSREPRGVLSDNPCGWGLGWEFSFPLFLLPKPFNCSFSVGTLRCSKLFLFSLKHVFNLFYEIKKTFGVLFIGSFITEFVPEFASFAFHSRTLRPRCAKRERWPSAGFCPSSQ